MASRYGLYTSISGGNVMSVLECAIIIIVAIVTLVGLDILINRARRRKRARQWKDKQKRMKW